MYEFNEGCHPNSSLPLKDNTFDCTFRTNVGSFTLTRAPAARADTDHQLVEIYY